MMTGNLKGACWGGLHLGCLGERQAEEAPGGGEATSDAQPLVSLASGWRLDLASTSPGLHVCL